MPLTNLLSDDAIDCTIILGEKEAIYGGQVRLHGSMWSRQTQETTGFNVQFPADHLYKGVRGSLILRRRDQAEIVCRHMLVNATGVPGNYDEFVYLLSPLPGNLGIARVINGNDDDVWLKSQFDGSSAQVFKMEGIRELQSTASGKLEDYKVAVPIGWIQQFDIADLGTDPEQYRWNTLIANHRDQDDYSGYIALARTFSLTGTNLEQQIPRVMDVEEWARIFGLQALCGIGDVYNVVDAENPHNLGFAVRPDNGKVIALQNDWSFFFYNPATEPLNGAKNLARVFNVPAFKRVYYGVMLDLINTVYNKEYMSRWLQHYGDLAGESYTGFADYITTRGAFAKAQFAKEIPVVPFELSFGGATAITTNAPYLTVAGRGWIDVAQVALGFGPNPPAPLTVRWVDSTHWVADVGLLPGVNPLVFTAYDRQGKVVGTSSVEVTTQFASNPQHDWLRVSELMYHPPSSSEEETLAGFDNGEMFEYVEVANVGPEPVPLAGVQFTAGVKYRFSGVAVPQLEPGQRVVVVRNLAAFQFRYPSARRVDGVYAGSLSNNGEEVRLVDAGGSTIEDFTYSDSDPWPLRADGGGSSLERLLLNGNPSDPLSWRASITPGGNPGLAPEVLPDLEISLDGQGMVHLRAVVPGGDAYRLEYRERLDAGAWVPMLELPAAAVPRVEPLEDEWSGAVHARYYRLRH